MKKRTLGNVLTAIGSPAWLGVLGTMNVFTASGKPRDLLWTVPIAILGLPLLPFYLKGEDLLAQADMEDFAKETEHLPKIRGLSIADNVHIEESEGKFYVWPFYIQDGDGEEPFDSLQEARHFLQCLGYQEVVDPDNTQQYLWGTCWIKTDKEI